LKNNCLCFDKFYDFKMVVCSIIIIILIFCLIMLSLFYKFEFSDSYNGIVKMEEGNYYVYILVDDNDISKIRNQYLVIDKERKEYQIVRIEQEYILTEYGPMRGLYLSLSINDDDKILNNVLLLNFVSKKTIFDKLKENF